eukprot:767016-Hanusia_phi.AAC.8
MEDSGARACLWTWLPLRRQVLFQLTMQPRGWGEFGRLGHGDTVSQLEPKSLAHEALNGAIFVACGGHHTVAVTEDGEVVSWGWGSEGQLGSGNAFDQTWFLCLISSRPQTVSTVCQLLSRPCQAIEFAGRGSGDVLGEGQLWGIGLAPYFLARYQPSTTRRSDRHVQISTEKVFLFDALLLQIACGMAHTIALSMNGEIYSWGAGADGQLGIGKQLDEATDVATPQKVVALLFHMEAR